MKDRAAKDEPYFLYFPMTAPHTPIAPAAEFAGKSRAGKYGDFVFQTDWVVGQVMDAIRESGTAENTIVIFTSDNGPENLTYPLINEFGHRSQGVLRGAKRMLWEGGHRVPFIAWGPGRVPAGKTEPEIICLTDLMATIANLTGYKLPNESAEDSYDIGPALFGTKQQNPIRAATVHHSMNNEYGLRQGDWVLIESPKSAHGAAEPAWWREHFKIEPHDQPGNCSTSKKISVRRRTCTSSTRIESSRCRRCWSVTRVREGVCHADENANVRSFSAYLLDCRAGDRSDLGGLDGRRCL